MTAGAVIEKEIGGEEKHTYLLPLTAGQFARIAVEQSGVDTVLVLLKPDGQTSAEVNNFPQFEPEYLSLIPESDGVYQLKVSVADSKAARARYTIKVEECRLATARDFQFVDAERKFSEARQLSRRASADSMRQSAAIYEDALQQWRQLGERQYEMKTLVHLGRVNERQQKFQPLIDFYAQALPIARELGDRRYEGISLSGIGWGWQLLGEYRKALEYYQPALAIRQSLGIGRETAQTLTAIGASYTGLGEVKLALAFYQRSLPLARDSGDKIQHAVALNSMAGLHLKLREYQRAIGLLQESLTLWGETGDPNGLAWTLNLTGMAYSNLFDMQTALRYYSQALELAEKIGDRYNAALTLNNLGVYYWYLRNFDEALAFYERALGFWREIRNRAEELRILGNLGLLYLEKGDTDKSLELFKAALGGRPSNAQLITNIAYSYFKRGQTTRAPADFQLALEWYEKALPLLREQRDLRSEAAALTGKAGAHRMLDQPELARKEIEQAAAIAEKVREEIAGPEHRISSQTWMSWVYRNLVHILMWLHQKDPSAGYDTLAFRATEQVRLRTLVELLSESRIELSQGIDPESLARLKELQLKIESTENRQAQAINRKHGDKVVEIEKELEELLRQRVLLDAQIRINHPEYAALKMPNPISLSEIQRELLDADTVLLEYSLGALDSYLWLITTNSISSYRLPEIQRVNKAAARVRELLALSQQSPDGETLSEKNARQAKQKSEFDQASAELSQIILGPVAGKLGKKRILIVGDGILQYIPLGVLPEPARNPQPYVPLIVNHEVVTLPSAAVLATLRQVRKGRAAAPQALAVLADPVFSSDDERVSPTTGAKVKAVQRPDQKGFVSDVERSAADSGLPNFRRLLFSRDEAEAIAGLLRESERLKVLDFAADRGLAISGKLGEYRILHFATHGLLNNKTPALSGLVFSLVDEQGQSLNGFLRLHEIYNLHLNADLVVLSGCQTALGREVNGEGLIGLTRGFMHAGASRVVASLWNVNDQATANLMKQFYQRMLKDRMRPAAALRAAQITMWKAEPNAVPHRWGAFILQGDWR